MRWLTIFLVLGGLACLVTRCTAIGRAVPVPRSRMEPRIPTPHYLEQNAEARCRPPMDRKDAKRIVKSFLKADTLCNNSRNGDHSRRD
jgi:hypothetical protein